MAEGGCLCGAVRYRVEPPAVWVNLCLCRSCRRATGAPAVAWARFRRQDFALIAGAPAWHRSSPAVNRGFCRTCGSSLFVEGEHLGPDIVAAVATLDDPAAFPPTMTVHTAERIPWMHPPRDLADWSEHGPKPTP